MMNDMPETLETLQQAEYWHGWLMTAGLDLSDPAGYDRARQQFYKALQARNVQWAHDDATNSAIDQMLRDTRASVLFSHTDGDTVERGEYIVTVHTERDNDAGAPWDNSDGHGPVSDWTTRDKQPGELLLSSDCGSARFYDYAEACRIARRDGWGISPELHQELFGPRRVAVKSEYRVTNGIRQDVITEWRDIPAVTPSARQIAAAAAMANFEYLRKWCNDQWHYVGVIVTVTDQHGTELAQESLWGIESHATEYLLETAEDLALQALGSLA